MDENQEEEQVLRSINNEYPSLVRFVNKTPCNVVLYWIDYQGQAVSYGALPEDGYLDIDTFVTHPWIFVDEVTGDRFTVHDRDVFFPEPSVVEQSGLSRRTRRTCIFITLPICTLRELAFKVIKKCLSFDWQAFQLEIPRSLQYELAITLPKCTGSFTESSDSSDFSEVENANDIVDH